MKDTNWGLVGYVKRSNNRLKALELLKSPLMPSELGREMKISLTHASKIIRELHSKGLIQCLNDDLKIGRIYLTTKQGSRIINTIKRKR